MPAKRCVSSRHGSNQMKNTPMDVLIIGTEPPCPRCDLLVRLVRDIAADTKQPIRLRHIAFHSQEAVELGRSMNLHVGTAKHVAKAANIAVDWETVSDLISKKRQALGCTGEPADSWTPELDEVLRPCQLAAHSVSYLMTPILLVNGKVRHHGSVPTQQAIRGWLQGKQRDTGQ